VRAFAIVRVAPCSACTHVHTEHRRAAILRVAPWHGDCVEQAHATSCPIRQTSIFDPRRHGDAVELHRRLARHLPVRHARGFGPVPGPVLRARGRASGYPDQRPAGARHLHADERGDPVPHQQPARGARGAGGPRSRPHVRGRIRHLVTAQLGAPARVPRLPRADRRRAAVRRRPRGADPEAVRAPRRLHVAVRVRHQLPADAVRQAADARRHGDRGSEDPDRSRVRARRGGRARAAIRAPGCWRTPPGARPARRRAAASIPTVPPDRGSRRRPHRPA
jgi:hypothetical protein